MWNNVNWKSGFSCDTFLPINVKNHRADNVRRCLSLLAVVHMVDKLCRMWCDSVIKSDSSVSAMAFFTRITIQFSTKKWPYNAVEIDGIIYLQWNNLQTEQYSVISCSTVTFSTIQSNTMQYSTIKHNKILYNAIPCKKPPCCYIIYSNIIFQLGQAQEKDKMFLSHFFSLLIVMSWLCLPSS